jgi:carbonic anhydrase
MIFNFLFKSIFAKFKNVKIVNIFYIIFLVLLTSVFSPQILAEENKQNWSYGTIDNPAKWAKINSEFALCELGSNQSPINIKNTSLAVTPLNLEFNYQSTPLSIINNGHTIQINYKPGSNIKINNEEYELLQFHFHTPSEHTINNQASAMELHLVHRNARGQLAVVGVMMQKGLANPLIDQIWMNIPPVGKNNNVKTSSINVDNLLPNNKEYFSYIGSLTTPPCSENVKWNVLKTPIQVSEKQIKEFQSVYQINARPVQSINNRKIEFHG